MDIQFAVVYASQIVISQDTWKLKEQFGARLGFWKAAKTNRSGNL